MLTELEYSAIYLTLKLASTVTLILLLVSLPLSYWLARTKSLLKVPVSSLIALPLVLPPSVIGFYLLISFGHGGSLSRYFDLLGIQNLAFSFTGLVIASVIYSLPFVVQPIQNAIESIGERPFEVAATLGANSLDTFFSVVMPLAKPGIISGAILGFTHTIGEFGIVLMIGGNIPGETQVISVLIYEHVEALEYDKAHLLSAGMLIFSFVVLLVLNLLNRGSNGLFKVK
ncbi:molybdate ABC transporter permease subunit [Catenovulum maritimum]|uniref:Molybdenum transport system permease n=1 Tax=Catenovulum maritimum TaxID=1513271 RepID=A0A0J8GU51_9ALTE|nr:molybdate ABC transporter permease subunit [Catenovulum maritimum]KMT64213.1 molybdenum ABC transporter permease [Catenovulum maritimum]